MPQRTWSVDKLWLEGDRQTLSTFGTGTLFAEWDEPEPGIAGAVGWSFTFVTDEWVAIEPGEEVQWTLSLGKHPHPKAGDDRYWVTVVGFVTASDGTGHSITINGRPNGLADGDLP